MTDEDKNTWQKTDEGLYREFEFRDFREAFEFIQSVAQVADSMDHHPRWMNDWNKVFIWLYTHSADAVTESDYELAAAIDGLLVQRMKPQEKDNSDEKITTKVTEVKIFTDGGSRGNPGPSAVGYVVYDMDDVILSRKGEYLGITTNNQAEYLGLKKGLEEAKVFGARKVHVYMDSLLVVNQMIGKFKVKNRDLWPIYETVKELVGTFEKVIFTHVPRALNKEADAAANEAMDAAEKNQ